jgi:hypothetical protein
MNPPGMRNPMHRFGVRALAGMVTLIFIASGFAAIPASDHAGRGAPDGAVAPLAAPGPEPLAALPEPVPNVFTGGDFLVSFDDDMNAMHPTLAITPPGSLDADWDGTQHVVWDEQNESDTSPPINYEIHYSQSLGADGGREWSNDEPNEDDRIISSCRKGFDGNGTRAPQYVPGDAVEPAVAVDMYGFIHVVWREMYSDGSWEILYSRSTDNGKSWSGYDGNQDKLVSWRRGSGNDEVIPSGPAIAVSNDKGSGGTTLHVVWAQFVPKNEDYEIFYSQSRTNGDSWTGATSDRQISLSTQPVGAGFPVVATSGEKGDFVHAAWLQKFEETGMYEIFVSTSDSCGEAWFDEKFISFPMADGFMAEPPSISSNMQYTIVTWAQPYKEGYPPEILYSFTKDYGNDWSGRYDDWRISRPDGEAASLPSIALNENGRAYAAWTELDQNKWGSIEVHISETNDIEVYDSWTGLKGDIIISNPDADKDGRPANAGNVSAAIGYIDGAWRTHAVWDEVNYTTSSRGDRIAMEEWEIITNVPVDVSIPVVAGWNLISIPMAQEYTDVLTVFNDLAGDGQTTWDRLMWYDPLNSQNHWKQYNKNWPSSFNDLTAVSHRMSVWIRITGVADGYLTLTGSQATSTSITLRAGWNLVGYPASDDSTYNVGNLKTDTGATVVEGFKATATYKTEVLANSRILTKGSGYWVLVPSDVAWVVDW